MKISGSTWLNDRAGLVGLLLFLLVAVFPIVFSLIYAAAYSVGWAGYLSPGFTLEHWSRLFSSNEIWLSFGLSVYLASVTVVLTAAVSLAIALSLRKQLEKGPLSYLIYLPLALPATVMAFAVLQWFSASGLFSRLSTSVGLIEEMSQFPEWVQDAAGLGILTAHLGMAIPFFALLFVQLFQTERLSELASLSASLGATRRQILTRVFLPVLLRRSITNLGLLFIFVLGSYEIPLLIGRQAPQMISVLTMRKYAMYDLAQKPEAFVIALLYAGLVFTLTIILFRRGTANVSA